MRIYVPTRGRWRVILGLTLKYLERSVRERLILVTHLDEENKYRANFGDVVGEILPLSYDTIDQKRLLIGQDAARRGDAKFIMLDDDLKDVLVRRAADSVKQRMATSAETTAMLREVEKNLDLYASVGVSAREANGFGPVGDAPVEECTRLMRAVAFRTEDFLSVEHCRIPCMEDHDVQLQLLRSGRKNAALYWWSQGQDTKNSFNGGCAPWRTLDVHNAAARRLAELHSGLVRLRETDKGALGKRVECTISWKKAYQS